MWVLNKRSVRKLHKTVLIIGSWTSNCFNTGTVERGSLETNVRAIYFLTSSNENVHKCQAYYKHLAFSVNRFTLAVHIWYFKESVNQQGSSFTCYVEYVDFLKGNSDLASRDAT